MPQCKHVYATGVCVAYTHMCVGVCLWRTRLHAHMCVTCMWTRWLPLRREHYQVLTYVRVCAAGECQGHIFHSAHLWGAHIRLCSFMWGTYLTGHIYVGDIFDCAHLCGAHIWLCRFMWGTYLTVLIYVGYIFDCAHLCGAQIWLCSFM